MNYAKITNDISLAAAIIRQGRVVAFPTGTSYGLAVDTQQGWALQRLRNLKRRPADKTFTVFMSEELWPEFLMLEKTEEDFLRRMRNKALTLLVKPGPKLEHLAHNELVGLRVIDHPMMNELADTTSTPLTATSANIAGEVPCRSVPCINQAFPAVTAAAPDWHDIGPGETTYDLSLGAIIDGGELAPRKPTTIAQLVDGQPKIIRQGELEL